MAHSGNKKNIPIVQNPHTKNEGQLSKSGAMKAERKPPKQAKWSHNDSVSISLFTDQGIKGKTSDNEWKSSVWTAAMVALNSSEMLSGGAPMSAAAYAHHWDQVHKCTIQYTYILIAPAVERRVQ